MIVSTSSIYGKSFRILSFKIKKLGNAHFCWKMGLGPPPSTPLQGFQIFLTLAISIQTQVLQTVKVSFKSENVDVNSGTFSKELPYTILASK